MRLGVRHITRYRFANPVRNIVQSHRMTPSSFDGQQVIEWSIAAIDATFGATFTDGSGDIVQTMSVLGPVDELVIDVAGEVETRDMAGVLRGHRETVPPMAYLRTTRATRSDNALVELAMAAGDESAAPLERAHALAAAVADAIRYEPGLTHQATTAAEAVIKGAGVCQDHTHALIAAAIIAGLPPTGVFMFHRASGVVLLLAVLGMAPAVQATSVPDPTATDRFLAGYASAILEREFNLSGVEVRVAGGQLVLDPDQLTDVDVEAVVRALEGVEGLRVDIARAEEQPEPAPTLEESQRLTAASGPLPNDLLFDPLIADPRWPRFSASLQFFDDETELGTVGSANFGGTLPLYGWRREDDFWQLGLQAGVFSIFDLEDDTTALINADYFVGLPLTFRNGGLSAQLRLYHQSSHLGDEFLLRNRVDRINLSYEVVDALLSIELLDALRLYGGGGAIVRSEPDLDPWLVQGGLELTSPEPWLGPVLFPIAALDVAAHAEQDFEPNYSLRVGFDVRAGFLDERRLMLLLEYFNGQSPNGQFFEQELEYFGGGLHFFF